MVERTLSIISGGSGSSKFITALDQHCSNSETYDLAFVSNVADNFWRFGLYICPDIDIVVYSLAKILDETKGWGIRNDTRNFVQSYSKIVGIKEWFNLGDFDAALSIWRTELIRSGVSLTEITEKIRQSFGIRHLILPATNDTVQTFIQTPSGRLHLQEFWVKMKGEPVVTGIEYSGIEVAKPTKEMLNALSETVLILPANPISSVFPTIKLKGVEEKIAGSRVVAISPFIGDRVFSGPAAKFMRALGIECNSFGVAKLYSRFLNCFLVDTTEDDSLVRRIKDLGVECIKTRIRIENESDKRAAAKEILDLF